MINECNGRPCVVYGETLRVGIFRGFSDNNDKCVIEFENGELHKTYVWKVQFLDRSENIGDVNKELLGLVFDINTEEILSHIKEDNLNDWIKAWRNAMLTHISRLQIRLK